jgi:DNA-binding MarR family transcriptional regulator
MEAIFNLLGTLREAMIAFEGVCNRGLSAVHYMILWHARDKQGTRAGDISSRLLLHASTLTPYFKFLEAEGYITRRALEDDTRVSLMTTTDKGLEALAELGHRATSHAEKVLATEDFQGQLALLAFALNAARTRVVSPADPQLSVVKEGASA